MNYYTQDWYIRSKGTGLYLGLKYCSTKDMSSPEFYEMALAKESEEVRYECEVIKNTSFEQFAEDRTESKEILLEEFERRLAYYKPEDAEFIVAKRLSAKIENLRLYMPERILKEVPDIRILALGYADERITEMITEYSEECRVSMRETDFAFEEEYNARTEPIPTEIWTEYGFEGGYVRKVVREGVDITIHMNNFGTGSDVTAMRMYDCMVERLDDEVEGARWICNEMYLVDGMYEFDALLENKRSKSMRFPEFKIHCKEVEFVYDR